jgi:hypothetical protein
MSTESELFKVSESGSLEVKPLAMLVMVVPPLPETILPTKVKVATASLGNVPIVHKPLEEL